MSLNVPWTARCHGRSTSGVLWYEDFHEDGGFPGVLFAEDAAPVYVLEGH